jgi:hypothetical protein
MKDQIRIGDIAPDISVPVLSDGPAMDLPPNATLNADGSVTIMLDYPKVLKYRQPGSDQVVREEPVDSLTLRRLTGADVRKMIGAKNPTATALALASGLGAAKLHLLAQIMDARDDSAANEVVGELLGGMKMGLPEHATETRDGVTLPLWRPTVDEEGTAHTEVLFKRLTAAQRRQAADAPNLLDWGVALATGITPKSAKFLVDAMDGADAMAVNQVILFLCGSGRRSSR